MTFAIALDLLLKYGPDAVALGQRLFTQIQAGRGKETITDADWAALFAQGEESAADVLKEAGVKAPPPAP